MKRQRKQTNSLPKDMDDELRKLGDMSIQDVLASIEIPITSQDWKG